jgi:hypothetical protein
MFSKNRSNKRWRFALVENIQSLVELWSASLSSTIEHFCSSVEPFTVSTFKLEASIWWKEKRFDYRGNKNITTESKRLTILNQNLYEFKQLCLHRSKPTSPQPSRTTSGPKISLRSLRTKAKNAIKIHHRLTSSQHKNRHRSTHKLPSLMFSLLSLSLTRPPPSKWTISSVRAEWDGFLPQRNKKLKFFLGRKWCWSMMLHFYQKYVSSHDGDL